MRGLSELPIDADAVLWSEPPGRRPILALLHGHYSDERDLFRFADAFTGEWTVASLRAPLPLGEFFEWFSIPGELPAPDEGLEATIEALVAWLDEIGADRVALFGFSQGGAAAFELWRRHPERVLAVVVVGGFAASAAVPLPALPPLLWLHGADDQVIADLVDDFRRYAGAAALEREYAGVAHVVAPEQLVDAAELLRRIAASAPPRIVET